MTTISNQEELNAYMDSHLDDNNVYQIGSDVVFSNPFNDGYFNFRNYIHSLPNYEELDVKVNFAQETDPDQNDCTVYSFAYAFNGCHTKTLEVTFGKHSKNWTEPSLYQCFYSSSLTKFKWKENEIEIDEEETCFDLTEAFVACNKIKEITIPQIHFTSSALSSGKIILSSTYEGCTDLRSFIYNGSEINNVDYQLINTFYDCFSIRTIDISKFVNLRRQERGIDIGSFLYNCSNLQTLKINYDPNNPTYRYDAENDQYYIIYGPESEPMEDLIPLHVLNVEVGTDSVTFTFNNNTIYIYNQEELNEYMDSIIQRSENTINCQLDNSVRIINSSRFTQPPLYSFANYFETKFGEEITNLDINVVFNDGLYIEDFAFQFKDFSPKSLNVTIGDITMLNYNFSSCFENSTLTLFNWDDFKVSYDIASSMSVGVMFKDCTHLISNIRMPRIFATKPISSVTAWMGNMFMNCSSIKDMDIVGQNFINIGLAVHTINGMFSGCSSIKHIDIREVTNLDSNIILSPDLLTGCDSLLDITIQPGNEYYTDLGNNRYQINSNVHGDGQHYEIPYDIIRVETTDEYTRFIIKEDPKPPKPTSSGNNKNRNKELAILVANTLARKNKLQNALMTTRDPLIRSQLLKEIKIVENALKYIQDKFM